MAWITSNWGEGVVLKPHKTDLGCFRVIKTRQPTSCKICFKKIPPKSYVYGNEWIRFCLDCGDKFSYKAIEGFKEVIKGIRTNQRRLKKNKDKWESENAFALL